MFFTSLIKKEFRVRHYKILGREIRREETERERWEVRRKGRKQQTSPLLLRSWKPDLCSAWQTDWHRDEVLTSLISTHMTSGPQTPCNWGAPTDAVLGVQAWQKLTATFH